MKIRSLIAAPLIFALALHAHASCSISGQRVELEVLVTKALPFETADPFEAPKFVQFRCTVAIHEKAIEDPSRLQQVGPKASVWVINSEADEALPWKRLSK